MKKKKEEEKAYLKINIDITKLRKKLLDEKSVIRIRRNKNDLVYYNGIKIFELKRNSENNNITDMTITENLYKLSFTDVKDILENAMKENISWKDALKEKIDLLETFKNKSNQNYFNFEMQSISFGKAGKRNYKHETMKERLTNFYNDLKNDQNISEDISHIDIDEFLKNFETEKDEKTKENKKSSITFKKPIKDIRKIFYIQYYYYKDLKSNIDEDNKNVSELKQTTSKPDFGSLIKPTEIVVNEEEISNLLDKIRDVVRKSNIKEFEKRYQFMFMLYASKMASNLFEVCYYPFEQEYVFRNQTRKKDCRIDCVFFRYDKTKITDLYLIELKVNDSVISGNNGVLTHLDDINSLFFNRDKEDITKEDINKDFFFNIKKQINYRMQQLDNKFECNNSKDKIDFNVHFYTIFGFTDEKCKKNIKYVLENLKTNDGIRTLSDEGIIVSSKNTNSRVKLDPYFTNNNINLQMYIDNKNRYNKENQFKYDFKFFFDKDIFDVISWNKYLYRDSLNLIEVDINKNIEEINW